MFIQLLPLLDQAIQTLENSGGVGVGSQVVLDLITICTELAPTGALLDQTPASETLSSLMICIERISGGDDDILETFLRAVDGNGKANLLSFCDIAAAPLTGDIRALRLSNKSVD
ncbi:uncharacterized protein PAC_14748 [Phialocephala subalpina]|uniref:Uncharacterized protein n=1 Tax=Phialocephala subalpina TaxID=576137 RepID=A0A1L7XIH1_9HELO|nr:uncharacterized protein PAC_14748 [Phialocephala subalpina]